MRRLAVALILAVVAVVGVWGLWPGRGTAGRARGFNLLLITLDTTRADCLGCYGHPVVRTPNIDALAREGVRFTQCTAAAPITLPSHASIMTATWPFVHRARNNGRYLVDEGNLTLAEHLKAAGYATGAEVGAFVLDAIWGIGQGFESFRSAKVAVSGRRFEGLNEEQSVPADDVCDRAVEWLGKHGSRRFFLWVHFFDPHQPYKPPERFQRQYDDPYLGEIAFVDEQVGRLLGELRRMLLDERTVIALVADHGESRGEHEEPTHVYYVYDSTMHVPLILRCPGVLPAGRVCNAQVRTVDVAPTALALLGLKLMPGVQGISLLPLVEHPTEDIGLAAYGESVNAHEAYGYARVRTLRIDGWKYIHAPTPELYDLTSDPGERVNLAQREPARVTAMRDQLEAVIAEANPQSTRPSAPQLDAAAVERLAALGYVGGYAPKVLKDELQLLREPDGPDPKDHIAAFNQFTLAQAWAGAGDMAKAETMGRDLVAAEPGNPAFRDFLADLLRRTNRFQAAAEQYEALLELQPDNGPGHYRLGKVLGELERFDESVDHLRQAVQAMPEYPEAHAYLALGLERLGNRDDAVQHFQTALRLDPTHEDACMGLSGLLYQQGRAAEAVQVLRDGLRHRPDSIKVANNLAWYLATCPDAAVRDGAEAVRLAGQVCQSAGTDNPAVLDTLAAAYAEAGRLAEAVATARRAIDLAVVAGQPDLAAKIRSRLTVYESGQPFRE